MLTTMDTTVYGTQDTHELKDIGTRTGSSSADESKVLPTPGTGVRLQVPEDYGVAVLPIV